MSVSFDTAARRLLEHEAPRLPDLSAVVVLLPHRHAGRPLKLALRSASGLPVLRPPRCLTLPDLAAAMTDACPAQPDSARLSALYALLGRIGWLEPAARWPTAQSLLRLLDDLDDACLTPPAEFDVFAGQIAAASRRLLARPLQQEAELAFQVWRAFHDGGLLGPRAATARRLAAWRERAITEATPLYVLGLRDLSRLERRFLDDCADAPGWHALAADPADAARSGFLDLAWPAEVVAPAPERARQFAQNHPASPLAGRISLACADDLEALAQNAAATVRAWLAAGKRDIGLVALDRVAARRLRALLERDAILLQDETGWTFSTAAVSHVIDRLLEVSAGDGYYRDVLDLLKSPFLFSHQDGAERSTAVHALERAVRQAGLGSGVGHFLGLARRHDLAATGPLQALHDALLRLPRQGRHPLADWLWRLLDALDILGATPAIAADRAGGQLLELLRRLAGELAGDDSRHRFADWRAWLNLQLDAATFIDDSLTSPLRLTHLAAARLRDFEAVLVLGADAAHLPGSARNGLFNDAVRAELGLPGSAEREAGQLADLVDLLGRADHAVLAWQAAGETGPNPLSPWLERLDVMHRLAYGEGLRVSWQTAPVAAGAAPEAVPAPQLTKWPAGLSASAWQSLVDCPYRYFARYDLGLGETEEVAEDMEKRDYGECVHAALAAFHRAHPHLAGHDRAALRAALEAASTAAFAEARARFPLAEAWLQRWHRRLDAYLDWALAHEAGGYRWQTAEVKRHHPLVLADGGELLLEGRLDRIDRGAAGELVIDYKTQGQQTLRDKLRHPGEDVQLPFYGLLSGAAEAVLVGLDDDRVTTHRLDAELTEAARLEGERLRAAFAMLHAGARLPAHGAPHTCRYCEMAGLCRQARD